MLELDLHEWIPMIIAVCMAAFIWFFAELLSRHNEKTNRANA